MNPHQPEQQHQEYEFAFDADDKHAAKVALGRHLDHAFKMVPGYAPEHFDRVRTAATFYGAINDATPHDEVPVHVYGRLYAKPVGNGDFVRALEYDARTAAGAAREGIGALANL